MLTTVTVLANYIFLGAAVWLGIYVVSRSPRNPVAWLTGLTLWSGAGLFLNTLLALLPPPIGPESPEWVQFLVPFWTSKIYDLGWVGWLQGWLLIPAVAFWLHATTLMRPGRTNYIRLAWVIFAYICALTAIILLRRTTLVIASAYGDPLFLNTLKPGGLFFMYIALLMLFIYLNLYNLFDSARKSSPGAPRKQFLSLGYATLIAGLVALVTLAATLLELSIPRVVLSFSLGIAVMMIGYGVAGYSALVESRTIRRDFLFSLISISLITLFYLIGTWILGQLFGTPPAVYLFVMLLAIITHSMLDFSRRQLDISLFRQDYRNLKDEHRKMADSTIGVGLDEFLALWLDSICSSVRATYGIILGFKGEKLDILSSYKWENEFGKIDLSELMVDDVIHLEPESMPIPLNDAALLLPLYAETTQIGAIVLGRPVNGVNYSHTEAGQLLYPSDQIAEMISSLNRDSEYFKAMADGTKRLKHRPVLKHHQITVKEVEDSLRHISDYAYLGDTNLVKLKLVSERLPKSRVTYFEKGKALNRVLVEAVDKLKPDKGKPPRPVGREWYPYMILHGAYQEDKLNRDIMSQLYISEGTFNRTRRSAIRSVTRILEEMEAALT
jgi:hypothetical protein